MELGGIQRNCINEISCLGFSRKWHIPILVNICQNNTFCKKKNTHKHVCVFPSSNISPSSARTSQSTQLARIIQSYNGDTHTHSHTHTHTHTHSLNSYTIPLSENLQWNTSLHFNLQQQYSALHQNLKARILATFSILWPTKTSSFRNSYRFMQLTRTRVLLWHSVVSQWKDHIEYWIWRKRAWISREWNVYRTTSFSSVDVQEKHSMKIFFFL